MSEKLVSYASVALSENVVWDTLACNVLTVVNALRSNQYIQVKISLHSYRSKPGFVAGKVNI